MRVLALTNLYPNPLQPQRAPFNRHQFRLLNDLAPVRVIAPISWTDEWRLKNRCPRRTTLDGLTVDHPRYWFPPKILRSRYGQWYRWSVQKAFRRAVKEFQPSIVFSPWAYPDGWAAVKLAREHNLKVVVQVHGSDVKLLDEFPAKKARTIETVTKADGVIAVSRDLAHDLENFGTKNVKVIYDGVDPTLFHKHAATARAAEKCVLFVGNLVPVKSVVTLLEAMRTIQAKLTIIGDGPLRASLEYEARVLGLNASFLGSIPHEELPSHYQAADLFVLPSRSEGVPNVLLEASACGTPWVASNVGGIPEIAHFGASRLVEPDNVAALATAIREMLDAPPLQPAIKSRLRTEAVAELHSFLQETLK